MSIFLVSSALDRTERSKNRNSKGIGKQRYENAFSLFLTWAKPASITLSFVAAARIRSVAADVVRGEHNSSRKFFMVWHNVEQTSLWLRFRLCPCFWTNAHLFDT